jgi:hypothetical protein
MISISAFVYGYGCSEGNTHPFYADTQGAASPQDDLLRFCVDVYSIKIAAF